MQWTRRLPRCGLSTQQPKSMRLFIVMILYSDGSLIGVPTQALNKREALETVRLARPIYERHGAAIVALSAQEGETI